VLQCAVVYCSVLQCDEVLSRATCQKRVVRCVLQCVAVCCSVLQCVTARCGVLQCAVVCCSVMKCVAGLLFRKN